MKKFLCLLLVFSCVMLTACNIRVRNKSGKDIVDISTDGIKVDAGDTHVEVNVGNIKVDTGNTKYDNITDNEETNRSYNDKYSDFTGVEELRVDIDMGNVNITAEDREDIDYNYEVVVRGMSSEKCDELADVVECVFEKNGNRLSVYGGIKGESTSLGKYIDKHYFGYTVSLNVSMAIPKTLSVFDIMVDMGNINLCSLKGKLTVSCDMGNIDAEDIVFTDDSELSVDMGNADVEIAEGQIYDADVEVSTDMGNVSFDCGNNLYREETDNDFMEKSSELIIGDKLHIDLHTDMGDVYVSK